MMSRGAGGQARAAGFLGVVRPVPHGLPRCRGDRRGPSEIAVGKVNVDEEPELAQAFRVQSIPMLVLLRDNAVVAAAVGAQSKEQLEQKLGL